MNADAKLRESIKNLIIVIKNKLVLKQDKLTAGDNVNIINNTISATDTIVDISGKADKTYVDDKVKTDVPANAKFTDTNTTYSEITTDEIDTGTASTLRTITGRRVKYILDKVQGWINSLTKSDVGLSNVDNLSAASIRNGTTKANVGLNNVDNVKQMPIAGGTFTGISKAQNNTSYTVAQIRNVILSTSDADVSSMGEGDIWIKYI